MSVDHLLGQLDQARSLSDLDHLLNKATLNGILACWVFTCHQNNYSRKTLEHYWKVDEFIKTLEPAITTPKSVTDNHVKFFLMQKGRTCKAGTVHGYYRAIHTYFAYMVKEKILKISPMVNMQPPKVPREIIQPYQQNQIKTMLSLCGKGHFTDIRNRAILLLYISSGLRKQEMTDIKIDDVDIIRRNIKVMGKGAKGRIVGFGVQAQIAIRDYYEHRKKRVKGDIPNLWISEEGKALSYAGVTQAIYDLKIRAGLRDLHSSTHALRHTFATESLKNGGSLKDVQSLMGHETPAMTLKYAKTVDSSISVLQHPKFDPVDHWLG